jgi:orotidine-5'-phosphate decarboxylase
MVAGSGGGVATAGGARVGRAPVAVALDAPDAPTALAWARATAPHIAVLKIGMELFYRAGPAIVTAVRALPEAAGIGVFLDLKLHDIPATVAGGIRSVAGLAPRYVTVHASGGAAMVSAAVNAANAAGADITIAAVTILTSLSGADLDAVGIAGPPADAARRLAELAVGAGAGAIVCSPQEVAFVRDAVGMDVTLITPGVRPGGVARDDQKRVMTPRQALLAGADLLVVGRPITAAADPGRAAAALAGSLASPKDDL